MSNEVAVTILKQIGGNRFIAMTGAKDFMAMENGMCFKIPKTNKINYVRITLNAMDYYKVEFVNIYKTEIKIISEFDDVGCDQLRGIFESQTGLYTSL